MQCQQNKQKHLWMSLEIMCLEAIFPSVVHDPIAFAASADPDTMYLHEALKEPDKLFLKTSVYSVITKVYHSRLRDPHSVHNPYIVTLGYTNPYSNVIQLVEWHYVAIPKECRPTVT